MCYRRLFPDNESGGEITIFLCLEPQQTTGSLMITCISIRLPPLLLLGLRHAKKLSFSEALFKCFSLAEPMLLAFCTGYIMKRSVRK